MTSLITSTGTSLIVSLGTSLMTVRTTSTGTSLMTSTGTSTGTSFTTSLITSRTTSFGTSLITSISVGTARETSRTVCSVVAGVGAGMTRRGAAVVEAACCCSITFAIACSICAPVRLLGAAIAFGAASGERAALTHRSGRSNRCCPTHPRGLPFPLPLASCSRRVGHKCHLRSAASPSSLRRHENPMSGGDTAVVIATSGA